MSEKVSYKKHGRNSLLRFALWETWGEKCAICGVHNLFTSIEIDHLIPQTTSMESLAQIKVEESLSSDFDVNGLENLVPACGSCNKKKRHANYSGLLSFSMLLREAQSKKVQVEEFVRIFRSNHNISKAMVALDEASLTDEQNQKILVPFLQSIVTELYALGVELTPSLYRPLGVCGAAASYHAFTSSVWIEGYELTFFNFVKQFFGKSVDDCVLPAVDEVSRHFTKMVEDIAMEEVSKNEYYLSGNEWVTPQSFACRVEKVEPLVEDGVKFTLSLSGNLSASMVVSATFDIPSSGGYGSEEVSFSQEDREFDCKSDFSATLDLNVEAEDEFCGGRPVEVVDFAFENVEVFDMS